MNRIYILSLFFCLSLSLSAQKTKELLIIHTNDTHSRIEPASDSDSDSRIAGRGGFVRRATLIDSISKSNKDMLLFDCGDFSQGTPFYNLFKGEVEVKLMNAMGYDAITIGNHEFDFGLENMARLFKMATFDILNCNYDVKGTELEGLVKPYKIIKRDGLKIGVLGVGPQLKGLVQDKNFKGIQFNDPVTSAQKVATYLKQTEKCDLVIALSHLGWQGGAYCDEAFIANTKDIDIVLGGHSHSYFEKPQYYKNLDGKMIPLQQMGKNAAFVGEMRVKFNKK